jgi:hypothetical protein
MAKSPALIRVRQDVKMALGDRLSALGYSKKTAVGNRLSALS